MEPRLGVVYEHLQWFAPLFAELDRRSVSYEPIDLSTHRFDPAERRAPWTIALNRMSPSAHRRGHGHTIVYAREFLRYLERQGVDVVNNSAAFALETSKVSQLLLLDRLGLPHPRSRVINHPREAPAAADEAIDLGIDGTALVQEFLPAQDGHIVRVEVLDGRFLYAIKVYPDPSAGFNLCPADICQVDGGVLPVQTTAPGLAADLCPVDLPKVALKVEGYTPPQHIVQDVLAIAGAAGFDLGGIEYLVSDRDGKVYYYDINVLSNFVTDAVRVVGFDPYARLVDYLVRRGHLPAKAVARAVS